MTTAALLFTGATASRLAAILAAQNLERLYLVGHMVPGVIGAERSREASRTLERLLPGKFEYHALKLGQALADVRGHLLTSAVSGLLRQRPADWCLRCELAQHLSLAEFCHRQGIKKVLLTGTGCDLHLRPRDEATTEALRAFYRDRGLEVLLAEGAADRRGPQHLTTLLSRAMPFLDRLRNERRHRLAELGAPLPRRRGMLPPEQPVCLAASLLAPTTEVLGYLLGRFGLDRSIRAIEECYAMPCPSSATPQTDPCEGSQPPPHEPTPPQHASEGPRSEEPPRPATPPPGTPKQPSSPPSPPPRPTTPQPTPARSASTSPPPRPTAPTLSTAPATPPRELPPCSGAMDPEDPACKVCRNCLHD